MSVIVYLRMIDDDSIAELSSHRRDIGDIIFPAIEEPSADHISLGKSFGEIREILQRHVPDKRRLFGFLANGGVRLGVGESSATAFVSSEVREIAASIDSIDESVIHEHCAPRWRRGTPTMTLEEFLGWLLPYFRSMREFLFQAVARRKGILVYASV